MVPAPEVVMLKMSDIFADAEFNCRGFVAPIDVVELVASIKKDGLLSPIIVQNWTTRPYRVVCGHRRFTSCELLGWDVIPCFVRNDLDENTALILNLQENINRTDLNIVQEAKALSRFKNWSQSDIARSLGMSPRWVGVRLKLLTLPEEIQKKAAAGLLSQGQIADIASLGTVEEQYEATKRAVDHKLSEGAVVKIKKKQENVHTKKNREIVDVHRMQDHIRSTLGNSLTTRVLGWVGGHVTTYEVFLEIEKEAALRGKPYIIPISLEEADA